MDVLLKEAGCCATKITGKAGSGRPRRFPRLYPTPRAGGKRGFWQVVVQFQMSLFTLRSWRQLLANFAVRKTQPRRTRSTRKMRKGNTPAQPLASGWASDCYTNLGMHCARQNRVEERLAGLCAIVALVGAATTLSAQLSKAPEMPPGDLVRAAVANEVAAANNTAVKHMFRSRKQTPKGSQTRLYVETDEAMAGMLIALNDQPLTPQQHQGELSHLAWLMNNPEQLRKKHAHEKEDADRTLRIVKALPFAFRYEYAGTEDSETELGKTGGQLVRLEFTPNPSYSPPSHVEQVLVGMRGYLLIDTAARRIARIDGTLFRDVTFGWGIIGHLDKGGHFLVQQADLGDGTWDITEMSLNITGKILLLKSVSMVSDEVFSDFRRVPENLTFAQGVELLKTEQEKLAGNGRSIELLETKKTPR